MLTFYSVSFECMINYVIAAANEIPRVRTKVCQAVFERQEVSFYRSGF